MIQKTEIQQVYENMQKVATAAAAAPTVAPLMPVVIAQIVAEIVKQIKVLAQLKKAEQSIPVMMKKINSITPPDYKKYRLEDPRRTENIQIVNAPKQVEEKPVPKKVHKNIINIPNTTQIRPKSG